MATLGAAETFAGLLGEIESIEFPEDSEHAVQGDMLARVLCDGGLLHRVLAPLSGQIITLNDRIAAQPQILDQDPFGAGWLVQIIPSDLERELPLIARRSAPDDESNAIS